MKISFGVWLKEFSIALFVVLVLANLLQLFVGAFGASLFDVFLAPFMVMKNAVGHDLSGGGAEPGLILPAYLLAIFMIPLVFLRVFRPVARWVLWGLWTLAWTAVSISMWGLLGA